MSRQRASSSKQSAGLLLCRWTATGLELFLVHPGGPFFARKDHGWWTLPKGLIDPNEDPLEAAKREFQEETGWLARADEFVPLGTITQKGGKIVQAWAFLGDCDPATLRSNSFEIEWPRGSGRFARFPEVDRAAFFSPEDARIRILPAQAPFIDRALLAFGDVRP